MAFSSIREMTGFDIHTIDLRIPPSLPHEEGLTRTSLLGPVVQRPIIVNTGLNFNPGPSFFCLKAFFFVHFDLSF